MSVSNYEELAAHVGHAIECVTYGDANAAVECEDCGEVLLDFDDGGDPDDGPGYYPDGDKPDHTAAGDAIGLYSLTDKGRKAVSG